MMITIQEKFNNDVLALKVANELSEQDLEECASHLEKHVASSDHPHLYMILDDFGGYESASAFMKDLQLDSEYIGYFDRIAVVGDKDWEKWGVKFLDPITKEKVKFFSFDEKEKAEDWINDLAHVE